MKILISACLLGLKCRYDGSCVQYDIGNLKEDFELVPFCPEVAGGLSTPRQPSEIRDGRVYSKLDVDVTYEYNKGAEATLKLAKENGITIAVLKERSPSCGSKRIYDGSFNHVLIDGDGVTAKLLKENGITVFGESEIKSIYSCIEKQSDVQ